MSHSVQQPQFYFDKTALDFTKNLSQKGRVIAEYIWIDGAMGVRSKARTLPKKVSSLSDIPQWNYDGSSCYQASTENSEIVLMPVFFFPDPFQQGDNVMVLCETYVWEDTTYKTLQPSVSNFRYYARQIFDGEASIPENKTAFESFIDKLSIKACMSKINVKKTLQPWFGIEQEYTLVTRDNIFGTHPYGWPKSGYPGNQGPYYCSVGANVIFGRKVCEAHYKACLFAGIQISGTNAEVMPGQWEYQVGPCEGIAQGDHLWASRYLL
mmetsp:Transcript_8528/g.14379  ORF Transcript_8528/g.14379 Transcript_8528/m.14379 type:complete len:267 (+) Transcript_8528:8-808(+)